MHFYADNFRNLRHLKNIKQDFHPNKKFSLKEKKELGEVVLRFKNEYDEERQKLEKEVHYNAKRKRWVTTAPKEGYISKAVRYFFSDLADVSAKDVNLKNACKLATR